MSILNNNFKEIDRRANTLGANLSGQCYFCDIPTKRIQTRMNFSSNKLVQMTLSCNFHQLSLTQIRFIAKTVILVCQVIRHIISIVKRRGILCKIPSNYVLNICLITFAWKFQQICEHWYNNFAAITVIHLYYNNISARTKYFSNFRKHKKNVH